MRRARRILASFFALIMLVALAGCAKEPAVDLGPVSSLINGFYYDWYWSNSTELLAVMNATVQYAEGATTEFQTMTREDVAAKFTPAWWGEATDTFWVDDPQGTNEAATVTAHLTTSVHAWDLTFGVTRTAAGWLISQIRVVQLS